MYFYYCKSMHTCACVYVFKITLWFVNYATQVFFYDGSITCFQSYHLGVSIFAIVGVVLVILFPVLILIISFRTYKVAKSNYNVVSEYYYVVFCSVYPTVH